jgi:hypothetical protein
MQHCLPMHRALLVVSALVFCTIALGCGPTRSARDLGPRTARSLYPMAEGYTWTYDIDTETEMNNLGVTRVTSVVGDHVEITTDASETRNYELREGGIYRSDRDVWLLRDPIAVGTEWPSSGGRTARITSVTETVDVFAGHYEGCVEVREEGGDGTQTIRTVFCQGVGPVVVEVVQNLVLGGSTTVTGTLRDFNDGTDDDWLDEE